MRNIQNVAGLYWKLRDDRCDLFPVIRLLLHIPNVTVHPSTVSVPITVLLCNGPLLCGFNVPIKGFNSNLSNTETNIKQRNEKKLCEQKQHFDGCRRDEIINVVTVDNPLGDNPFGDNPPYRKYPPSPDVTTRPSCTS